MPGTRPGKWSLELTGLFGVLLVVFMLMVVFGQRGGETFFANLYSEHPHSAGFWSSNCRFLCWLIRDYPGQGITNPGVLIHRDIVCDFVFRPG